MQQQVYRIMERTGLGNRSGVDKENFIRILDGIQTVRDDNFGRTLRKFFQDILQQLLQEGFASSPA